jgi:hypothetical protein
MMRMQVICVEHWVDTVQCTAAIARVYIPVRCAAAHACMHDHHAMMSLRRVPVLYYI